MLRDNVIPVSAHEQRPARLLHNAWQGITLTHLSLFLIMYPFDRICSELVLISWLLHSLVHFRKEQLQTFSRNEWLLLLGIFLLQIPGLLYTDDFKEGLNLLLRQLALLLLPFCMAASGGTLLRVYRVQLLRLFGFICTLTVLYLYVDALRIIFYFHLPLRSLLSQAFLNHNFSKPIGIHATYLSLGLAISAISFMYFLLNEQDRKWKWLDLICLLILFAGMIQLASKAVLISFLIISVLVFPFFIPTRKQRLRFTLLALIAAGMAVAGIIRVNGLQKRYVAGIRNDFTQESINQDMIESRLTRWKAIFPLVQESPLLGHGTGASKKHLQDKYFENRLYNSYLLQLNTHNQYLHFMVESGLIGFLIYILILAAAWWKAWRRRDPLFLSLILLVAITGFTENLLSVNKGIFFIAFFFSFFILSSKPRAAYIRLAGKAA